MKIFYVILTCDKYIDTRVRWQKESWVTKIDERDYVYLDKPVGEESYVNVAKKYVEFLRNFDRVSDYNWFFFCDDDTFVFPIKLSILLSNHDHRFARVIGKKMGEFKIQGTDIITEWCSGGAGIAISSTLANNIKEYVSNSDCIVTGESDTSLGVWCKLSTPDFHLTDKKEHFRTQNLRHEFNKRVNISECITFHYCTEIDFDILKKHL